MADNIIKSAFKGFKSYFAPLHLSPGSNREMRADSQELMGAGAYLNSAEVGISGVSQSIVGHNYMELLNKYRSNGLALQLIDLPLTLLNSSTFKTTFDIDPPTGILREIYQKTWDEVFHVKDEIFIAKRLSRLFGVSYICALSDEYDNSLPLNFDDETLHIKAYDPLDGMGKTNISDMTSKNYLKIESLTISGKPIHPTRYRVVYNGQVFRLGMSAAARTQAPLSSLERVWPVLDGYENYIDSQDMLISKIVSVIITTPEVLPITSTISSLSETLAKSFKNAKNPVVMLPKGGDAKSLSMTDAASVMQTVFTLLIQEAAIGSDIPAQELMGSTLAQGLNSGQGDLESLIRYSQSMSKSLLDFFDWTGQIVTFQAFNRYNFDKVNAALGGSFRTVEQLQLYIEAARKFEIQYSSKAFEEMQDKRQSARLKNILFTGQTLNRGEWAEKEINSWKFFDQTIQGTEDNIASNTTTLTDREAISGAASHVD